MNQVALITGGGGGIGGAVARRMAAAGIAVVIADYDGGAAEKIKSEIVKAGGSADALAIDVTASREVKAVVTDVEKRFGHIDILATSPAAAPTLNESRSFPGRSGKKSWTPT